MSKVDELLSYLQSNVGEWCCSMCGSGSTQPAAIFREIKKLGYVFEEPTHGRWAKQMYCNRCKTQRSFYKLLKAEPDENLVKKRCTITAKDRERVLSLLDNKDAFTGATISSTPEIDHKTPWTRLEKDINIPTITDKEVIENFQLLTREHNLLKDRACGHCKLSNKRPPLFGIRFWYDGDDNYHGTCSGCGWYDGKRWREELNKTLEQ